MYPKNPQGVAAGASQRVLAEPARTVRMPGSHNGSVKSCHWLGEAKVSSPHSTQSLVQEPESTEPEGHSRVVFHFITAVPATSSHEVPKLVQEWNLEFCLRASCSFFFPSPSWERPRKKTGIWSSTGEPVPVKYKDLFLAQVHRWLTPVVLAIRE
jgi:hypothetical protein